MCLHHLLVGEVVCWILLDLGATHGESWVHCGVGEVVAEEVVLQERTAPVDVEPNALKHGTLLQFA